MSDNPDTQNPPPFTSEEQVVARLDAMAQTEHFLDGLSLSGNPRDWAAAREIKRLRARVAELEAQLAEAR